MNFGRAHLNPNLDLIISQRLRKVRERPGVMQYTARLEIVAEYVCTWFDSLDEDSKKVLAWQDQRFERDMNFRQGII